MDTTVLLSLTVGILRLLRRSPNLRDAHGVNGTCVAMCNSLEWKLRTAQALDSVWDDDVNVAQTGLNEEG
jgi:hypothetical protein